MVFTIGSEPLRVHLIGVRVADKDKRPDLKLIKTSPEDFEGGEPEQTHPEFGDFAMPADLSEDAEELPDFLQEDDDPHDPNCRCVK